jgi:predicted RNase H-like nuclease
MVFLEEGGAFRFGGIVPDFATLPAKTRDARLTLVDVPVGLPEGPKGRECDRAARRLLGPRRSSVFPVPVRRALAAETYEEACAVHREASGRGLSRQTWGIVARIREADGVLRGDRRLEARIRESHPELCFAALNVRRPMEHPKREEPGAAERRGVLERRAPGAGNFADRVLGKLRRGAAGEDDLLDAMVLARAAREAWGQGVPTLPETPPRDTAGLRMEMVCPMSAPR